jgi:Acyl-coenzyme A:6-aminopenicillanic acid acyl-transferase
MTAPRWARVVLLVVCWCLGAGFRASACTVFSDSQGDAVLAGRNWDMFDAAVGVPVMWVVPARDSIFGRICFGRHDDCEDGMNDQGLFVAIAATPPDGAFKSRQAPVQCPVALDHLLAHCATVDEAIAWWEKQTHPAINCSYIRQRWAILGIKGAWVWKNSGVGGHILMADKGGNSVVCEWEKGKLKVIRKTGRFQLMTNFLLSEPEVGGLACPRFAAVTKVLKEAEGPSVATCASALKASSTKLTRYSVVYDLAGGDAHVYCGGGFEKAQTLHLSEELRKGAHEVKLDALSMASTKPAPE